jgi:hypothetical protein
MSSAKALENWPWAGTRMASAPGYLADMSDNRCRTFSRIWALSEIVFLCKKMQSAKMCEVATIFCDYSLHFPFIKI